ncbi:hypothetical protein LguiA_003776 [Lonicera macranthoides]
MESMLCMVAAASKGQTLEQLLSFIGLKSIDELNLNPTSLKHFDLKYNLLDALHIPKFKFPCQINASDTMKELGLTRPFMAVKELMGIVESPQSDIMYMDKILQKACIEVNEEGTEAAAVECVRIVLSNSDVGIVGKADEAIEEMNSWSEKAPKGLIKNIISGSLKNDTVFILNNILYFKGAWAGGDFFYGKFNGFKFLRIPYEKGLDLLRFSMYFILPDEKDGLKVIAEKMNSDSGLFNQCFELDWEELTRILDSPPNGDEIYVIEMEQLEKSCYHPFLFMVRDDTSGAVLFTGAVLNPALAG